MFKRYLMLGLEHPWKVGGLINIIIMIPLFIIALIAEGSLPKASYIVLACAILLPFLSIGFFFDILNLPRYSPVYNFISGGGLVKNIILYILWIVSMVFLMINAIGDGEIGIFIFFLSGLVINSLIAFFCCRFIDRNYEEMYGEDYPENRWRYIINQFLRINFVIIYIFISIIAFFGTMSK